MCCVRYSRGGRDEYRGAKKLDDGAPADFDPAFDSGRGGRGRGGPRGRGFRGGRGRGAARGASDAPADG